MRADKSAVGAIMDVDKRIGLILADKSAVAAINRALQDILDATI